MICYLDSSALLKRYVAEPGTDLVARLWENASVLGSTLVTRAELPAALAKSVRMDLLGLEDGLSCNREFERDWQLLYRLELSEAILARASELAWAHGLRGYDAVHLASAAVWSRSVNEPVVFATFDARLWHAASAVNLLPFPQELPGLLERWRKRSMG